MPLNQKSIPDSLCHEVFRKLQLAIDAETKDDKEVVCAELFADITGSVDNNAQDKLKVPAGTRFYQILAPYFSQRRQVADDLLHFCRKLWGQPYVAPVYALLLYEWLLVNPDAGGEEQRQKHVNVLISGARQLFWGDVQSSMSHFQPLFHFLTNEVIFCQDKQRLDALPTQSRSAVISVVACFLPYYDIPQGLCRALETMPVPEVSPSNDGHVPGAAADFALTEVTDTLRKIKSDRSLLKYLSALNELKYSPYLATTKRTTKLRLQSELHSLTSSGGPRYLPRSVNQAAFHALDSLFPYGRRSRRLISVAFKFLHPTEWGYAVVDAYRSAVDAAKAWLLFWYNSTRRACLRLVPVQWRHRRRRKRQ